MALKQETPTPASIKASLDREVAGQEDAKDKLAVVGWRHAMQFHAPQAALEYTPRSLLLIGPPGSGKTTLVAATARAVGVPYCRISAPAFVGSGFAGMDRQEMLTALSMAAGGYASHAQRSILQIDQLDQIRFLDQTEPDLSTRMTQHNLTQFLRRGRGRVASGGEMIDTSPVLIVLTGSSEGCEWSIRTPAEDPWFPHGDDLFPEGEALNYAAVLGAVRRAGQSQADRRRARIEAEDLVQWGFLPELLRNVDIIALRELDPLDLLSILEDSSRSPVESFRDLFALYGVSLEVTRGARLALAEAACHKGKSAAALDGMLEALFQPSLLKLPHLRGRGVTHIAVTRTSLRAGTVDYVHGTPVLPAVAAVLRRTRPEEPDYARENSVSDKTKLKCVKRLKKERLGWAEAAPAIQTWWDEWEAKNQSRPDAILNLVERLAKRGATLNLFHTAFCSAQTENIEAVLHYLDYLMARNPAPP